MTALLVGDPSSGALEACRALGVAGTVVWHDAEAIREATDELVAIGWDALLVNPDDEGFSTASMSHWAQLHESAPAAVLWLAEAEGAEATVGVALMVMRHLPALPVLVAGPAAPDLVAAWEEPRVALELAPPAIVPVEGLADAWAAAETVFAASVAEHASHDRTAHAGHHH